MAETPGLGGFHHVGLTVRDLAASAAWYADLLGLVKVSELPDQEGRGAKVILRHPSSGFVLGLAQHQANAGEPFSEFRTGLDHVAFAVPSDEALEAWRQRLDEQGVRYSPPYPSPSGLGNVLVFRDPDNIQLEFYVATPPRSPA